MTLDQFRSAYQTGGLVSVGIKAAGAAFLVNGHPRQGEPVILATSRGRTERRFANLAKAIALLHQISARKIEVDTAAWSPTSPPTPPAAPTPPNARSAPTNPLSTTPGSAPRCRKR